MIEAARVLIVEDEPDLADNLLEVLAEFGAVGEVVTSAEAALARLTRAEYRGVITDFRLPGMTGVELLLEMRRRGIELPVVLTSAFMDHHTTLAAEEAGALDVLGKPLDLQRLEADVTEFSHSSVAVLLVEDNVELAENVSDALEQRGLSTLVTGSAAGAFAQRKLPRVAIVDIRLPDQSGIEVARRLAMRDPRIRILFVSAYADEYRDRLDAMVGELRGIDAATLWLDKPCDVGDLASRVWLAAERG